MDPVSYGDNDTSTIEKSDNAMPDEDLTITVPPQDYTDTISGKEQVEKPPLYAAEANVQSSTSMKKIENKLKRLVDLGDINATKQTQIYMDALTDVGKANPQVASVLELIKAGLGTQIANATSYASIDGQRAKADPTEGITDKNALQKIKNYERVIKEIKKQLACYKQEISNIKKTESYITMENYQKLVNDFNSLYDHFKAAKQLNKKLKSELQQSNQRERTFLKLLKKTNEYGDQAHRLEKEYDRLFTEDGLSKDPAIGGAGAVVERGGVTIPKLDFSVIYMQREQVSDAEHEESNEAGQNQDAANHQHNNSSFYKQNKSA